MTKPIRSRVVRLNLKGVVYFITALTYQRRPIFADDNRVAILRDHARSPDTSSIWYEGIRDFARSLPPATATQR